LPVLLRLARPSTDNSKLQQLKSRTLAGKTRTFFVVPEQFHFERAAVTLVPIESFYTTNPDMPEQFMAYPESYVRRAMLECGFSITEPLHYGFWSTGWRIDRLTYQDVIIAGPILNWNYSDDQG
jgi:hypothetical protein